MLFMSLHICAELELAMAVVVDFGPDNNCSRRTENLRYSVFSWETVEPEDAVVDELDDNPCSRDTLKQQHGDYAPRSVVDSANVCSISGTCSSRATAFRLHLRPAISPFRPSLSNLPSNISALTLKPRLLYVW